MASLPARPTITQLSRALLTRQVSSRELTAAALASIGAAQAALNSFITVVPELALAAADRADNRLARGEGGPLTGIPFAHKDIFCTAGIRTTCGSRMLDNFVSPYDATAVERLAAAGVVTVGKTNMDEFAMGSSNETSWFGPVRNPWDRDRSPGGSSGGSAAAVAAGLVPAATGTDTGGSIRQPAALVGITGLKPTYGRVSRYGMIAFASSLDQAGVLTLTAEDAALLTAAMAGFDPRDSTSAELPVPDYSASLGESLRGRRIGVPKEFFDSGLEPGSAGAIREALRVYERLGATLVELSLPSLALSVPTYYIVAPAECSSNLSRFDGVRFGYRHAGATTLEELYKKSRGEGFGAEVKRRILTGTYVLSAGYYDAYYLKAQQARRLIADDFRRCFAGVDVIAGPTAPTPAFRLGEKVDDPVQMYLNDIYTIPVNLAGLPGISIPCGLSAGLPVGLQLIGPHFGEAALLNFAHAFQLETDWHQKMPPVARAFHMTWETVIGLEVHAQLATRSKIFSGSATAYGAEPNTQASLVDLGYPGVLPVLNGEAVRMAVTFGLAIGATVAPRSVFARKNYFYPDLPKGYQISQYELPIVHDGHISIDLEGGGTKSIHVIRAHLEEDAGKSLHENFAGLSGIDLNRAGTPLLEIVSAPDLRSAKEAVAYMKKVHQLVRYLGICDGNMQEGSFRCDANVSVRRAGADALGTRTESKNLNSFRFLERAILFEVQRQIEVLEGGGRVVQETRLYDPDRDETRPMRSKEEANDYRYFPDPDLLPVILDEAFIGAVRRTLPELPDARRQRWTKDFGLKPDTADVLAADPDVATLFDALARESGQPVAAANTLQSQLFSLFGPDRTPSAVNVPATSGVLRMAAEGAIARSSAKDLIEEFAFSRETPDLEQIVAQRGLKQISDSGALEKIVTDVLAANPLQVEQYRAGQAKVLGFLVGQIMKASGGKANPAQVNELLKKKL